MSTLEQVLASIDVETRRAIIAHVETAQAFERKRQPVLTIDSKRKTSRQVCTFCNIGIRPETTPVDGMHPMCVRVYLDPREALKRPVNGHAARALLDALYVSLKRNNVDVEREQARAQAHRELLARFELNEQERESKSESKKQA